MEVYRDGPANSLFEPFDIKSVGSVVGGKDEFAEATAQQPAGEWVCHGIPFKVGSPVLVGDSPVTIDLYGNSPKWLLFLHSAGYVQQQPDHDGIFRPARGEGFLNQVAATYRIKYSDGSIAEVPIRLRHQIGHNRCRWGENCFEAVAFQKPRPVRPHHEQAATDWGHSQTRADSADRGEYVSWVWAWQNVTPAAPVESVEILPGCRRIAVFGITGGEVDSHPTRWKQRRSAIVKISDFSDDLDEKGRYAGIQLDLGQVILARKAQEYPTEKWSSGYNNMLPVISEDKVLVDFTAHPQASFHLEGGRIVAMAEAGGEVSPETPVRCLEKRRVDVRLKVVEKGSAIPVPVKLHVHGEHGQYFAPVDRHRVPNHAWFEDYSVDFVHHSPGSETESGTHFCTYIPGETTISLPPGKAYVEISKGYEVTPKRLVLDIGGKTDEVVIELERVLRWRELGWVSADTHVHFLSPMSSLLEGSAEGVNIVNLLASQWGELMTNVGDFDGKTTWGSREAGGDGEYLVRVGTENRQHVLGHISLLGYEGSIIAPMTTGGPDESAVGDPIGSLLSEWAKQCKTQDGVVIIPHFPNPRAENAAVIVDNLADGVEMTSWGNIYGGLDPYSLSDWYRFLNCGYQVAAVGGTDKMSANTPVGAVRTYARTDGEFTYDAWKAAVRKGETFVTYGPLVDVKVDGTPIGGTLSVANGGATAAVEWNAESATIPMTSVELVVNGRIRETASLAGEQRFSATGSWNLTVEESSWCAVLVRGAVGDRPEIIAAHTSATFVTCGDSPLYVEQDAITILEQIEGAMAYIETVGTRAETNRYREIKLSLESTHRRLHNRMHQMGYVHEHTAPRYHREHDG